MAPMDNGDFIAQMAQFSTVTGIEENGQLDESHGCRGSTTSRRLDFERDGPFCFGAR